MAPLELERKYLGVDFGRLRARLAELGARTDGPHFEANVVFDTSELALLKAGRLLRLREREWPGRSDCQLTFKAPPSDGDWARMSVKARIELETGIGSPGAMFEMLRRLGYAPVARYEKARESWHLDWRGPSSIELDRLPFGGVVEIEAGADALDGLERLLEVDKCEKSLKTYHELNQEWRAAQGLPEQADLLFAPEERQRLRAALGL